MEVGTLSKITSELKDKYPSLDIKSIEVDESSGKSTLYLGSNKQNEKRLAHIAPRTNISPALKTKLEKASVISRDYINRDILDLSGTYKDAYTGSYEENVEAAIRYYKTDPIIGAAINIMSSLACKGFEHDIDDDNIKNFYDVWAFDVEFEELLEWIYLDFFKVGNVYPYKVLQKYEPRVSTLSPNPGQKMKKVKQSIELSAKKNIWSKGHLPTGYTILNPLLVSIEGNLLFNNSRVTIKLPDELKKMLEKSTSELSDEERELIKALPSDLKKAAEDGDEYTLDARLVSHIAYRKPPYERYANPRYGYLYDSLAYKKNLRQADLSTLDGISNYILKITVGNDEFPVTSQEELETVAALFDTPQKSFDVVWNHTLQIEKIVSPEIGDILGKEKYEQVNDDISAGVGVIRSIIDGSGDINAVSLSLAVKGMAAEIEYARSKITRWIYREYRQIAEAMGFERFPKVRWDDSVLKDNILYMSTISQLVDRRMISYRTALEALNFDYPNELRNMKEEFPLVEEGTFGIIGSPWQQSSNSGSVQNTPDGSPSEGRPSGKPAKKKEPDTDPNSKLSKTTKNPSKSKASEGSITYADIIRNMTDDEYMKFIEEATRLRR